MRYTRIDDHPLWTEEIFEPGEEEPPKSNGAGANDNGAKDNGAKDKPGPLPFIDISNWDKEPVPDQEWTVADRIPRQQTALFSGEGGAGKSTTTLQLCAAHALTNVGLPADWLGSIPEPGPAVFLDAEDNEKIIHRRLAAISEYYCCKFADLIKGGLHLIPLAGDDAVLGAPNRDGKIVPTARYKQLLEFVGDIKPTMIGIASAADVFAGKEVDRSQVQQFVGLLTRLAIVANGSVNLISHPSLTGISSDTGLSGSTQWHNSVRARFYLKGIKPEGGEQPDGDLREIVFKKNNYGPISESIVLRYTRGLFLPVPGVTNLDKAAREAKATELFLALLEKFIGRNENVSHKPTARAYAPTVFADEPEAQEARLRKEDFKKSMGRLFKDSKIHTEPYGPPSKDHHRLVPGRKP